MPNDADADIHGRTPGWTIHSGLYAEQTYAMLQVWSRHPPTGRHTLPTRADQAPTSDTAAQDHLAGLPSDQVPLLSCSCCSALPGLALPCPALPCPGTSGLLEALRTAACWLITFTRTCCTMSPTSQLTAHCSMGRGAARRGEGLGRPAWVRAGV